MGLPMCRHGVARGSGSSQMNTFGENTWPLRCPPPQRMERPWVKTAGNSDACVVRGRARAGAAGARAGPDRRPLWRWVHARGAVGRQHTQAVLVREAAAVRRGREVQVDRQRRGVVVRLRWSAGPPHPHPPTGLRAAEAVGACSGARAPPPRPTRAALGAGLEQLCAAGRGESCGTREAGATGGRGACWRVFSSAIRGSAGWSAAARSVPP